MDEQKRMLRTEARRTVEGFSSAYLAASDAAIAAALLAMEAYHRARTVFCYVSVGREVDTWPLLRAVLQDEKRLCVPRCRAGGEMDAVPIAGLDVLGPAPFGLLEPPAGLAAAAPEEIDLAIIPCLMADRAGYRLGQGGGYYDRYLPRLAADGICLCRAPLLRERLPRAQHDVPARYVLTEVGSLGE